jgi:hypothetical protein
VNDPAHRAPLGILMLETRFPRPLGDIGNPASFAHPVRYTIVRGAGARMHQHAAVCGCGAARDRAAGV